MAPASIAQETYLHSLVEKAYPDSASEEWARIVDAGYLFDRRSTSAAIDRMKSKAAEAARIERAKKAAKVEAEFGIGIYRNPDDGAIYRVVKSRESGRLYAKRLVVLNANSAKFEYAAGGMYKIKPEWRMSLDEAKAWGLQYGLCCYCAANLSDPKSVAAGIGPVCAKRV